MSLRMVFPTIFLLCIAAAMKAQTFAVEASEKALKHSQLTQPGSKSFHLIANLTEKDSPDSDYQAFEIEKPTSPAERITSVKVSDDFIRKAALGSTEIEWPTVGEGLMTGGFAVYVSADRMGQIREAWPAGCDNAALGDPLRKAMLTWKLNPPSQMAIRCRLSR